MYTPEEFAQSMKKRGIVSRIADARRYVKGTGKQSFDESDFEDAWRNANTNPVGREYIREFRDDEYVYYKKDKYGDYWMDEVRDI